MGSAHLPVLAPLAPPDAAAADGRLGLLPAVRSAAIYNRMDENLTAMEVGGLLAGWVVPSWEGGVVLMRQEMVVAHGCAALLGEWLGWELHGSVGGGGCATSVGVAEGGRAG